MEGWSSSSRHWHRNTQYSVSHCRTLLISLMKHRCWLTHQCSTRSASFFDFAKTLKLPLTSDLFRWELLFFLWERNNFIKRSAHRQFLRAGISGDSSRPDLRGKIRLAFVCLCTQQVWKRERSRLCLLLILSIHQRQNSRHANEHRHCWSHFLVPRRKRDLRRCHWWEQGINRSPSQKLTMEISVGVNYARPTLRWFNSYVIICFPL